MGAYQHYLYYRQQNAKQFKSILKEASAHANVHSIHVVPLYMNIGQYGIKQDRLVYISLHIDSCFGSYP